MTLIQYITALGAEIGLQPQIEAQRTILDQLINRAAEELYTQTDLPRSLFEETFIVDEDDESERITLPYRCGEIRGIRDYLNKVSLHDMRPRYHERPWPKNCGYVWRLLCESPICRSIDNAVALYMTPVDIEALTVTITGRTADAETATAVFDENGEGTAETALWEDIYSITKDVDTAVDVILQVGDADGAEIARIPNLATEARYLHVQLTERVGGCEDVSVGERCYEVLYKPNYRPLVDDNSTFQVPGFATAILAKAVQIWKLRGADNPDLVRVAQAHAARADDLARNAIKNKTQAQELVVQFGPVRGDTRLLSGFRKSRY